MLQQHIDGIISRRSANINQPKCSLYVLCGPLRQRGGPAGEIVAARFLVSICFLLFAFFNVIILTLSGIGTWLMNLDDVFRRVRHAIDGAPRNDYTAELHLQIIKYAELFQDITAKDFCAGVGVPPSYAPEFAKMRKIASRLRAAGLNPAKI